MVLYNVTVGIDKDVESEWLNWMLETHIPEVMETEMFETFNVFKIISEEEEATSSYSIQYHSQSMTQIENYLQSFAPALIQKHMQKYREKHVAFRTLLEKIA